jgi:hypothetical protein
VTNPRLQPPAADAAPVTSGPLGQAGPFDLVSPATAICRRYRAEFPDEAARYGDAGNAWCVHDNQHLLNWAVDDAAGHGDLQSEVGWLASVLEARQFPLTRLARNLDIAAEVAIAQWPAVPGGLVAGLLVEAASYVRSHGTFLVL